ncbi:MAG: hypothetical protein H6822_09610 [Planctomycetaceae bacterium]|nr:hypothetical protein [Planctomycetales bacterium]MCB9922427.1 hypothetical protein [Planctomycetaceae bacterium]
MDVLFLWDDAPSGNVEHVAEHGLTPDEVESAFNNIEIETNSRSTGRPAIFGRTLNGDVIFVVYDLDNDDDGREFIYVHTAYFAEEE